MPPQLYVRASNRLVGDFVMTQNNLYPQAKGDVSIAVGNWSLDQHMTGKYAVPTPTGYEVVLEGNYWPSVGPQGNWCQAAWKRFLGGRRALTSSASATARAGARTRTTAPTRRYDTPFDVMVPKRGTDNLLVPVAVSASAVAFSSMRIENWLMSMGSAAGAAAT